ncbi:isoaspartyl peptidase/L-asparaginase family protein [Aestuariibacter salexigens]|uniref:isoaspartyl peptidase/L-asparaginase family protein n=1 Tax=Aestuariibacter salexigens TaxID=226010 RepID=UPI0009FE0449|nr:isoaspartyl peptidase/L-asparaginase [Aestuariibacter salexigens]
MLSATSAMAQQVAIAIHGGAGTITRAKLTEAQEQQYRSTLTKAVQAGYTLLKEGKPGLDAVTESIRILENSPLFNAGYGAVYTYDGRHELDASIMHGGKMNAGAVSGVTTIKNPIDAARLVMEKSVHVMLSGEGAESFARLHSIPVVENSSFDTPFRYEALQQAKQRIERDRNASIDLRAVDEKFGTVGAVVLDAEGNLVAGTSTGGMTAKRYGRIGDSPIIGAGTYAANDACAVSATGHGEFFIRYHVAADICARVKYSNMTINDAAGSVIHEVLKPIGGDGGVIAIDSKGNIAMPFNTEGMYRASVDSNGKLTVAIYK